MRCDAMQCEAMRYSEGMVSTNTFLFWFCGYKHISAVRVMSAAVELLDRYSNRARLLLSSFLHSWQALSVVSERGITPPPWLVVIACDLVGSPRLWVQQCRKIR